MKHIIGIAALVALLGCGGGMSFPLDGGVVGDDTDDVPSLDLTESGETDLLTDDAFDAGETNETSSPPCGSICISSTYSGPLDGSKFKDMEVLVLPSDLTCDQLVPGQAPPEQDALCQVELDDLYSSTLCDCIPADSYYTVYASWVSPSSDCIVASACDDGVFVQADKCRYVTLAFYTTTLDATGQFDSMDTFDFSNLVAPCNGTLPCFSSGLDLGSQICCLLEETSAVFQTPGETWSEVIVDYVKQTTPSCIPEGMWGAFKDAVTQAFADYLAQSTPPWATDFYGNSVDLLSIVSQVELQSELTLSPLQNNYSYQGVKNWTSLSVNGPDGKLTFELDQLQDTQYPISLIDAVFSASVSSVTHLWIDVHVLPLDFGRLVLFAFNEIILANMTNGAAHSLEEVLQLWMNCQVIAQLVFDEVEPWFQCSLQEVEDACKNAVGLILSPVESVVGQLLETSDLDVQGHSQMLDSDCDLKVDELNDGTYLGNVQTAPGVVSYFTGTFEAKRQETP